MAGITPTYDAALADVLHKVGPKVLKDLENSEAPTKAALTKVNKEGEAVLERVKQGENSSFGFMEDGAATATGDTVGYETYTYQGKIFFGKIKINRAAAVMARGSAKSTADLVVSEVESAGKTAMRQLNFAIINGSNILAEFVDTAGTLASINAMDDSTAATVTSPLALEVRAGQVLDLVDLSATAVARRAVVTGRTLNFVTGVHSFTMLDTLEVTGAYTAVVADYFVQKGAYASGMTGLRDVVGSAALYGLAPSAIDNWKGTQHAIGGAVAAVDFRSMKTALRSNGGNGGGNNFWLMNSERHQDVYEIGDLKATYQDTKVSIGDYTSVTTIVGDPIVVDESMASERIFTINKDDVQLAVFKEMFQDGSGAPGKDQGNMHFEISQSALTYQAEMWGIYNIAPKARHTSGELTGITQT